MRPEICIRASGSYDAESRIFAAIFAATPTVDRRDAQGPYREILPIEAIDPAALVGRTVFLDHRQTTDAAVGVVVAARREGGGIAGEVQLSAAASVEDVRVKVAEGVIRSVSIGVRVGRWRVGRDESGRRTMTAENVSPIELSLVGVGADPAATIRHQEESHVDPETEQTTPTNPNPATIIRAHVAPTGSEDPATQFAARVEGLTARMTGAEPSAAARNFAGLGFAELAFDALQRAGETGLGAMSRESILQRALHGTSDFPALLTGAGQRTLRSGYDSATSPLKSLTQRATASDFRKNDLLAIGGLGTLAEVTEHGEITATSTSEAKESWQLKTYARTFGLTRKALIDDDLAVFGRVTSELGRAAAETENSALAALLLSNPVMVNDGVALFNAAHNNLATTPGGLIGITAARLAMRKQVGITGERISVTPKYLVVGPELEASAEQLLAQIYPTTSDDVNPFAGKLDLMVEPRISDGRWYIFCAPTEVPVLLLGHLASAPGPQISSREGWETLGREFRVVLDFGVAVTDHRGAYFNPGK